MEPTTSKSGPSDGGETPEDALRALLRSWKLTEASIEALIGKFRFFLRSKLSTSLKLLYLNIVYWGSSNRNQLP